MVNFIIKSLVIIDYESQKANKFNFGDHTNLIISATNTTGKSSILKSLYYALGVSLKSIPDKWDIDNYIFQIIVKIDEVEYTIERHNKIMSVKDNGEVIIFKDFKEYSTWLQNVLKMNLTLVNSRNDNFSHAYASAIFAPIYIDQDSSWDGVLYKNTFNDLGQYKSPNFQKDVVAYYLGLADTELKEYQQKKTEIKQQLNYKKISIDEITNVYNGYKEKFDVSENVTSNVSDLENQVNEFINETNKLSMAISKSLKKISKYTEELDIEKQDEAELTKIITAINERLEKIDYECSYCHSKLTREQSLTRLELNDDLSEIYVKESEIKQKILILEDNVGKERSYLQSLNQKFVTYKERISEINEILTIKDYVNQKVLKELGDLRRQEDNQYSMLKRTDDDLSKSIRMIQAELRKTRSALSTEFEILKNNITKDVRTTGITNREFGDFSKVSGSGTEHNKSLLSLYLIYFQLISKNSAYKFPMTIDSFTKNELDEISEENMYKAIREYFLTIPNQTFFAIIKDNLKYIDCPDANVIEVEKPILLSEKYKELSEKLFAYTEKN